MEPAARASDPLVVEIARGSEHDGPGLRSVVFFKGCSLRCSFCHNPETRDPQVELAFSHRACLRCGRCAAACPTGAAHMDAPEHIDRESCTRCMRCTVACPSGALRQVGRRYTPRELAEVLLRDRPFYAHSGGGITLSGGECLLYPDYLMRLLPLVTGPSHDIVVQTAGHFSWERAEPVLRQVGLVLYDIKLADPQAHRRHLGRSNERIVRNLERLLLLGTPVQLRMPLIPGLTTTDENMGSVIDLLRGLGVRQLSLLPYNPAGLASWPRLGLAAPDLPRGFQRPDEIAVLRERFARLSRDPDRPRPLGLLAGELGQPASVQPHQGQADHQVEGAGHREQDGPRGGDPLAEQQAGQVGEHVAEAATGHDEEPTRPAPPAHQGQGLQQQEAGPVGGAAREQRLRVHAGRVVEEGEPQLGGEEAPAAQEEIQQHQREEQCRDQPVRTHVRSRASKRR
jgi:pyruvate formate lyase activating enzyme